MKLVYVKMVDALNGELLIFMDIQAEICSYLKNNKGKWTQVGDEAQWNAFPTRECFNSFIKQNFPFKWYMIKIKYAVTLV